MGILAFGLGSRGCYPPYDSSWSLPQDLPLQLMIAGALVGASGAQISCAPPFPTRCKEGNTFPPSAPYSIPSRQALFARRSAESKSDPKPPSPSSHFAKSALWTRLNWQPKAYQKHPYAAVRTFGNFEVPGGSSSACRLALGSEGVTSKFACRAAARLWVPLDPCQSPAKYEVPFWAP